MPHLGVWVNFPPFDPSSPVEVQRGLFVGWEEDAPDQNNKLWSVCACVRAPSRSVLIRFELSQFGFLCYFGWFFRRFRFRSGITIKFECWTNQPCHPWFNMSLAWLKGFCRFVFIYNKVSEKKSIFWSRYWNSTENSNNIKFNIVRMPTKNWHQLPDHSSWSDVSWFKW